MDTLRYVLVPGGGGSGEEHWHHRWDRDLSRTEWVHQSDPAGGTRATWLNTLDHQITTSSDPCVLVAHSLACIAVAHWAAAFEGPVVGALLVAPADVEDDWAEPDSLYKRFAPIPRDPLPMPTTVVASTNDPLLSVSRATELADAWRSELTVIGDHLHVGSDAKLDAWPDGRSILGQLVQRCTR